MVQTEGNTVRSMRKRAMKSQEAGIWSLLQAEINISITSQGLNKYCGKEMWHIQYLNWLSVEGTPLLSLYLITYLIKHKHTCFSATLVPAASSPPHCSDHQPHMELLSCPWGIELKYGPTRGKRRTSLLRGDECSAAYGASCSASVRADEWGGEADKLGHTNVAFLGNAVKTLEECSWVAARAYNWGRAALAPLAFPVLVPVARRANEKIWFNYW